MYEIMNKSLCSNGRLIDVGPVLFFETAQSLEVLLGS